MTTTIKQPLRTGVASTPMVMQMEALECGAACLTMILAYYGRWLPLQTVRQECGVSRDGSKAVNVMHVARKYGLTAKGYHFQPDVLQKEGSFPCILHWNNNHFVVCNGFKGKQAYINDPARGEKVIPISEFNKSFSGVALLFEPSETFEVGGHRKSVWEFIHKRLHGSTPLFIYIIATAFISTVIGMIYPALSRFFTDFLLPGNNTPWLMPFIVLMSLIAFVNVVMGILNAEYLLRMEGKFAIIANTTFFWHILKLPIVFFSQRMTGDIASRQALNEGIASDVVKMLAPLILKIAMLVFYFIIMLQFNIWLTFISLVGVVVNLFISTYISQKRIGLSGSKTRYLALMTSTKLSGIEMIETVKATGAENAIFEKWAGYRIAATSVETEQTKLNSYMGSIPGTVALLINHIILAYGIYLIIDQQFTAGMLLAFQGFLSQFIAPVSDLINVGQNIAEMRTNMERIDDVMEYDIPQASSTLGTFGNKPKTYDKLAGNIELRNITFGYSKLSEPLLKDFSISIRQGQRIAIVGASGCGKSTVARLISGLHTPWSGEILYDGKRFTDINRAVFTGSIAVVEQDIVLFSDSIADNIKMWDSSIEDFEMILAARDAFLHEDIMERDGGYLYKLAEGGSDFSGGQRQRMEIARALACDPTVIIMDEATSSLDARTESDVVRAINARGITCIVIAHRLSTIRCCDVIYVMENGAIAESGSHEQLISHNGRYAKLVASD